MKTAFIQSMYYLGRLLPMQSLLSMSGQWLFAPFYHTVKGDAPIPHIKHLYRLRDEGQFEKDLDQLLRHYEPIGLEELIESVQEGRPFTKPRLFLSFDDGLREVYDIAAPILQAKGVPATIFLNSAFVDNRALFYRYQVSLLIEAIKTKPLTAATEIAMVDAFERFDLHEENAILNLLSVHYPQRAVLPKIAQLLQVDFDEYLHQKKPYLNSHQIKEMIGQGFTFGAHSVDHPLYAGLALEQQLTQTQQSLDFIRIQYGVDYKAFAFPFHDIGVRRRFFQAIQDQAICELTFGSSGMKQDAFPFHIHRFPMEESAESAERLLRTHYFYYLVKALFKKNRIERA